MRIALFCHSLLSDWNHGNAHFLRGVVTELQQRGHEVHSYECRDAWSMTNLLRDHGTAPLDDVMEAYPDLQTHRYSADELDIDAALEGVDLVIVHEWNPPWLVNALGERRARGGAFRLLFHDTHHRAVTAPDALASFHLDAYDGVLAFGETVREAYLSHGWSRRVWTWHEAADARVFRPLPHTMPRQGLVWIGNWGDDERSVELREFLIEPVRALGLPGVVHGVRYPVAAQRELDAAGLAYRGWVANHRVPQVFSQHRVTVHVPRRPYAERLRGIPTIRPFEALACGIPLISAPWEDSEGLFRTGRDYLIASTGHEMQRQLRAVLNEPDLAQSLADSGRETILARHTCGHRVDALLDICRQLGLQLHSPRRAQRDDMTRTA